MTALGRIRGGASSCGPGPRLQSWTFTYPGRKEGERSKAVSKKPKHYYARYDVDVSFDVGSAERHHVSFHWDAKWGTAIVQVDGQVALRERHLLGIRKFRRYELSVGEAEQHSVVIEKRKPLAALDGSWRHQSFVILVDGFAVEDTSRRDHPGGESGV